MQWISVITLVCAAIAAVFSCCSVLLRSKSAATQAQLEAHAQKLEEALRVMRIELTQTMNTTIQNTAEMQMQAQKQTGEQLHYSQSALQKTVADQMHLMEQRVQANTAQTEQQLENIRKTMEGRLTAMQADNAKKLDEMRHTVDEKLQRTLDDKLQQSFSRVSEQLERVYHGLGEMQTLAAGVGDLKKVLGNVKTRGILGEIQLGAILEQVLSSTQYAQNVATVPGSADRVEFAVKLPGAGDEPVWLPVDAKFPADAYAALLEAYDAADATRVESAAKALEQRVRTFAKDISEKYIHVPQTTEFGIMFLPVEGLYAEVVRRGMVEKLQADYKIIVAGPTTMAALLNSLQMGFQTLAIQKRSGEVWQVLGSVKAEFDTFGKALEQTQARLDAAGKELEKLVGVRTRVMQRKLSAITSLPATQEETDFTQALPPL